MIDIERMKALATALRDPAQKWANLALEANRAANAIDTLLSELEAREADRRRLDFLDRMNIALNKHYGTQYGWKLILSPNIVRLMSGRHHGGFVGDVDLNDANSGLSSFDSCRKAIDEALAQRQEGEDDDRPRNS
ncbi:hypothetical protein [Burkholderia lata]|uniref:Uncharacterized protein n=1 Tax=Burkholderia lata (strain ATCC 17760 / DSM 23089 / LMG 22485 / NCIMB 9086 / R18194 / 383) TaxID=482957 RepID=A0A6P2GWB7_BURL3|nr:hypothetical protein [Burkholderia lata]VWB08530.1 hypothetical protein BLA6863_00222 [Burkholderia lata]